MIAVVALVGLLVLGCNGPEFYTYKRGTGRTIGPFAIVPRNIVVREGTTVAGNVTPETALLQVEP